MVRLLNDVRKEPGRPQDPNESLTLLVVLRSTGLALVLLVDEFDWWGDILITREYPLVI